MNEKTAWSFLTWKLSHWVVLLTIWAIEHGTDVGEKGCWVYDGGFGVLDFFFFFLSEAKWGGHRASMVPAWAVLISGVTSA